MGHTDNLTVADWRDLYEGMTQKDDGFRKKMAEKVPDITADNILSEFELAQNRLTYAMMGIHPIYLREIELSGFIDYPRQVLSLYMDGGERVVPFKELDPSYVEFLENQKRTHNTKDLQPLSSVAIRVSEELYPGMKEHLEPIPMNTDGAEISCGAKMLKKAWERSTLLMNHIHEEMAAHGIDKAYAVDRDDLRAYCTSNIYSGEFDRSIAELTDTAYQAAGMDGILNQS